MVDLRNLFTRTGRKRFFGYRPQALTYLISKNKILLLRSKPYPDQPNGIWNIPQEGIDFGEDEMSGAKRGLNEELGLDQSLTKFKKSKYLGKIKFPKKLHGERELEGALFKMKGKAYWACLLIAEEFDIKDLKLNPNEASEAKWMTISEALEIYKTLPSDKNSMFIKGLKKLKLT